MEVGGTVLDHGVSGFTGPIRGIASFWFLSGRVGRHHFGLRCEVSVKMSLVDKEERVRIWFPTRLCCEVAMALVVIVVVVATMRCVCVLECLFCWERCLFSRCERLKEGRSQ